MPAKTLHARVLDLVGELSAFLDLDELREGLLSAIRRAVPCDYASLNQVGQDLDQNWSIVEPPMPIRSLELFYRLAHQNPLAERHLRTRDGRPYRISDVVTPERFHQTDLYRELYAPIGIEYQISFALPSNREQILAIALSRCETDFTDQERELLAVARPHLIQIYRNALHHSEVTSRPFLRSAPFADQKTLQDLGLTPAQAKVLSLIASGRSTSDVAGELQISERTVQKHLQGVFHRLGVSDRSVRFTERGKPSCPRVRDLAYTPFFGDGVRMYVPDRGVDRGCRSSPVQRYMTGRRRRTGCERTSHPMRLKRFAVSLTVAPLGAATFAAEASACTTTYSGLSGGQWGQASNWSPASVPTATDDVCISGSKEVVFVPYESGGQQVYYDAVKSITVGAQATLEIEGESTSYGGDYYQESDLTTNNSVTINTGGTLLLDSTAINVAGDGVPHGATSGGQARLYVDNDPTPGGQTPTLTNNGRIVELATLPSCSVSVPEASVSDPAFWKSGVKLLRHYGKLKTAVKLTVAGKTVSKSVVTLTAR